MAKANCGPRADDERLAVFATVRDFFRYAVSRFNAAGLVYGHGTTNAVDEAAFIVLEALRLPIDALDPFLDASLTREERVRLLELIDARVATRKPAAYLLNRAYIQGVPFYVDERVIVPRSFIGELLFGGLVGEGSLIEDAEFDRQRARSVHGRRLAGDSRGQGVPERPHRRGRSQRRRARCRAAQRRRARPVRPDRAPPGRSFRPARRQALRSDSRQSALCRRRIVRRVSARIRRRAAARARRRQRRIGRRSSHLARRARPSDARGRAGLRGRARPRAAGGGVPGIAADLARHRGERRRGVLRARRRSGRAAPQGEGAPISPPPRNPPPSWRAEGRYSAAARIEARMLARKSSIETSPLARSTCQNVQPLQAGRPWTSAPIL